MKPTTPQHGVRNTTTLLAYPVMCWILIIWQALSFWCSTVCSSLDGIQPERNLQNPVVVAVHATLLTLCYGCVLRVGFYNKYYVIIITVQERWPTCAAITVYYESYAFY